MQHHLHDDVSLAKSKCCRLWSLGRALEGPDVPPAKRANLDGRGLIALACSGMLVLLQDLQFVLPIMQH